MFVSCKVCTCLISILMKKMNLVGDSCMYISMQGWNAAIFLNKRVSPGRLSYWYPQFVVAVLGLPGVNHKEGPAPCQTFSP